MTLPMGRVEKPAPTRKTTLTEVVRGFKIFSSMKIHQVGLLNFNWQRSFFDHVVRDDHDLEIKRQYIVNNPLKWDFDRNNPNRENPVSTISNIDGF